MREARACENRRVYYLDQIERVVIGGLREELGTREAIDYFVRCYNEERRRAATDTVDRRCTVDSEIAAVETPDRARRRCDHPRPDHR